MVFPREPELITMERLLTRRIEKIFDAMDEGNANLFDEITDEIEMLVKLVPPIYNDLMERKQELIEEVKESVGRISEISNLARDDIYRQRFLVGESSAVEWDFRKDYVQAIFDIMGKYQLIPFETPIVGEMQSAVFEEVTDDDMPTEDTTEVEDYTTEQEQIKATEPEVSIHEPGQQTQKTQVNPKSSRLKDRLMKRKKTKFEV